MNEHFNVAAPNSNIAANPMIIFAQTAQDIPGANMPMPRYQFVVHSNPAQGREEEFNEWYWNNHYKDILAIPGVVSGRRFTPAAAQFDNAHRQFQYLAIYELDVDDPQVFIDEMMKRAASGSMSRSTSVASGASVVIWQAMLMP